MLDDLDISSDTSIVNDNKPTKPITPQLQTQNIHPTLQNQNIHPQLQNQNIYTQPPVYTKQQTLSGGVYNINIQQNNNDIRVKYNNVDSTVIFYNRNNIPLGVFSIIQLIKYTTSNISKNFLRLYDHESAVAVIEKYFMNYDKTSGKIALMNHLESPITGNLEIVLQLYTGIEKFEKNHLKSELEKSGESTEITTAIENKIKHIMYLVLNHALKLIVNISEIIKNDKSKSGIKGDLVKSSISIINKLNHFIKESIDEKVQETKKLEIQIIQLETLLVETNKKMDVFSETINIQSEQIKRILDYINIRNENDIVQKSEIESNASYSESDSFINSTESENKGVNKNFRDEDFGYDENEDANIKGEREQLSLTPRN